MLFYCAYLTFYLSFSEWDSDISSFLLLLHFLSPQVSGRKKVPKMSISQAIDHLVVFQKVGNWCDGDDTRAIDIIPSINTLTSPVINTLSDKHNIKCLIYQII